MGGLEGIVVGEDCVAGAAEGDKLGAHLVDVAAQRVVQRLVELHLVRIHLKFDDAERTQEKACICDGFKVRLYTINKSAVFDADESFLHHKNTLCAKNSFS